MQTNLADWIKDSPQGLEADAILRKCVHCGFCLATCPTYGLLGDELDSPRGRIYLMKQMLEGAAVTETTQIHLDRCLTCRACETTCPSGVQYGRLVDIGRELVEEKVPRGLFTRAKRWVLRHALLSPTLFGAALGMGRAFRGLLPESIARTVPALREAGERPAVRHARRMLVLEGCVQPAIAPSINAATARVLDRLGISLLATPAAACCGAVSHHLNAQDEALGYVRANIDAWWPQVEAGAEAIVITASGCGTMVAEYGHLLRNDPAYATKAARISALAKDVSEIVAAERAALAKLLAGKPAQAKLAFHSPCSLQHGLRITGVVESILRDAGFTLTAVPDGHLCCGSAGTYSILQPELSQQLLANKVTALESGAPEMIATANIGCLSHIASGSQRPVRHWIEILDDQLRR
ncbi:glycolate oxidase subunit GlcF [Usitatibacter palustris]|uniref:Glycolate oxidase iron-sulfur subunit n=1 Tax=Usitatibacter palustris TaxID=2732487 RepID=A0A6M4H5P9_9PROT|nr:glycolate oxidase subunit GlcF [Usitatibacter palustris]QJR13973.1 Lactate utilization protein A [Usitatibacter palustris]